MSACTSPVNVPVTSPVSSRALASLARRAGGTNESADLSKALKTQSFAGSSVLGGGLPWGPSLAPRPAPTTTILKSACRDLLKSRSRDSSPRASVSRRRGTHLLSGEHREDGVGYLPREPPPLVFALLVALLQDQNEHLEHLRGEWTQSPTRRHTLPRADLHSAVGLQDRNQTNALPGEGPMSPRDAGPGTPSWERQKTTRGAGSKVLRMAALAISVEFTDFTVGGKAQKEKQTYVTLWQTQT